MSYLEIDKTHGLIKNIKVRALDDSNAETKTILNKLNLFGTPNGLIEKYHSNAKMYRWIFYGTLMLFPIALYACFRKSEEDD